MAASPGTGGAAEDEEQREVVRVRVKKVEGFLQPDFRTFAVDPQITSLDVLQHILIRAFDLSGKKHFGISYLGREKMGPEVYIPLTSEGDLSAAFTSSSQPYLQLRVDVRPLEESPLLEDWDIISPKDVIGTDLLPVEKRSLTAVALPFTQSILSQVGRTLSKVQQVLSWSYGEDLKPFKPPLSDAEFHTYLNREGQLCRPEELRLRIYHGGVEPSLRKVVWRYLLNVYPDGLTGQERMDYMKRKTLEYNQLKSEWQQRTSTEDLEFIRSNVLKDVLRTDRAHPYYAGPEDNPHLLALHDLLTTYAVTHPQISYCQGMSDIASPILAVMDNEGHAFICFCGIMKRLEANFRLDGEAMSVKFSHLKLLLQYSDPEFYSYLLSTGADDLFFCYRWLLLELKREFAFEDALRMLEVTWSSLPPDPPEKEVELVGFPASARDGEQPIRQRHMLRPTYYGLDETGNKVLHPRGDKKEESLALEESEEPASREKPLARQASVEDHRPYQAPALQAAEEVQWGIPSQLLGQLATEEESTRAGVLVPLALPLHMTKSFSAPSLRPLIPPTSPLAAQSPLSTEPIQAGEESSDKGGSLGKSLSSPCSTTLLPPPPPPIPPPPPAGAVVSLPPPQEFGRGNPFMLFLCLAILLEHRDHIMKRSMDYNELAMHFDRLVRRHHLGKVLHRAKTLFADYLQSEVWDSEEGDEAAADSPPATASAATTTAVSAAAAATTTTTPTAS
ncbi:TBC1 domain family member 25 isoform X1 [Monodelphis domestica]|uniref:TBC1 domain family member 25 n=1 Tax=Monodelphis domestica TaxID=13616 RepID=F6W5K4_MONDO|nr:TBC1 domain family member 25 isoform X1 [Monodelphis domestica]